MKHQLLRGTGATVSRVCLGTMTFGQQVDEAEAGRILGAAMDGGVNFIDTADVYVNGESEIITGNILKGKRDQVVLASKVGSPSEDGNPRTSGLHKWHILKGVEASLKRLQTDCLDILYLHRPDRNTPVEETLEACDQLTRQGKALYIGTSNHSSWKMMELELKSKNSGYSPPCVTQLPYNLITRGIEDECLEYCETHNIGLVVYNALAGGLLTGKHTPDKPVVGSRFDYSKMYFDRYFNGSNFQTVDALQQVAAHAGISLIELSLQWLYSQAQVDSILLGASRVEQLEQSIHALDGKLDQEVLDACDHVWKQVRGNHFKYYR
ncbi:MAG: aldo/keto reductase [Verrucomicrobia bacterium]|nr:aldo/keto reductase [Verrucomicrobiota bacterium]MDA1066980.1 aldo/keto reductase [Verrucomicrobiota bacterium]